MKVTIGKRNISCYATCLGLALTALIISVPAFTSGVVSWEANKAARIALEIILWVMGVSTVIGYSHMCTMLHNLSYQGGQEEESKLKVISKVTKTYTEGEHMPEAMDWLLYIWIVGVLCFGPVPHYLLAIVWASAAFFDIELRRLSFKYKTQTTA